MRRLSIICTIVFILLLPQKSGQAQPSVSADHAILMEELTGRVLFEKNAYDQKPIASITKVMTAILAIEHGNLDDLIIASRRAVYAEGSSIYLELGEEMSLEDLLYGLMLRSGNDAAIAIAEHIGGSVEGFVYMMNERAQQLGMTQTNFINPHGLHDDNHYSTAYDMALLMRYAIQNSTFQTLSETTYHQAKTRTYGWKNKNRLLNSLYEHCTGGKTGFTKKSGRTLMTTAQKADLSLIAVTLNAPDDWNDHINLYNWGFDNYRLERLMEKGQKSYPLKRPDDLIIGYIEEDVFYPVTKAEFKQIKRHSYLLKEKSAKDSMIGKTIISLNGKPIIDVAILADGKPKRTYSSDVFKNMLKISGIH